MVLTEDIIQRDFLSLYISIFPDRELVQIISCSCLNRGWESDLFVLVIGYQAQFSASVCQEELILKIYAGEKGAQKAKREFYTMRELWRQDFPVPRVLHLGEDERLCRRPYLLMEKIEGPTFRALYSSTPFEQQSHLLTLLSQLQARLHSLDWQPFCFDRASYQPEMVINTWLIGWITFLSRRGDQSFDPVLDWLDTESRVVTCQKLSLIHGDFHLENIMLRDTTPFVIDWTASEISDFRFDLAWTLINSGAQTAPTVYALLRKAYERQTGQVVEHLEFFEVAACLRRLFDILDSVQGGGTLAMKPEAATALKRQVPYIQRIYSLLRQRTDLTLPAVEFLLASLAS